MLLHLTLLNRHVLEQKVLKQNPKKHGLLTRKGAEKYKDISYSTYATYKGTVTITIGGENKDVEINDNTNISQN